MLYLVVILICAEGIRFSNAQQCNEDQLNRCESTIVGILESNGYSKRDAEGFCRNLYRRLNCVITQTSLCLRPTERHSKSSIILKTWRFLESICDGYAAWWRSECYQQDSVKHCETSLSSNKNINYETCRNYRQFRECTNLVIQSRCSAEDQALIAAYLLDKGREKTWICSGYSPEKDNNYVSSSPLASNFQKDEDCRATVRDEARRCRNTEQGPPDSSKLNDSVYMEKFCSSVKMFKECVTDLSRRYCNYIDWDLYNTMKEENFGKIEVCSKHNSANRNIGFDFIFMFAFVVLTKFLNC